MFYFKLISFYLGEKIGGRVEFYIFQSIDCSVYSKNKPKIKIIINIKEVKIIGKLNVLNM
jgi:hypothetical protein